MVRYGPFYIIQSNNFNSNNTEIENLAMPVMFLKKPIPSGNSSCIKSVTLMQYVIVKLCVHQSARICCPEVPNPLSIKTESNRPVL